MSLRDFIAKQWIDVIEWVEPEEGILAYRYPMQDREIQNGGKLTVRESQFAVFVNEGKVADSFRPGLYTLNTETLPILTYLKNWDKAFKSPFKSDVYFFSARIQTDQHWGTQNPISIRDKEFGAIRLRGFGIYSYHLSDAKSFYSKISGTRDIYHVADLEGQLRNTIIAKMTDAFAASQVPFLDMAANQGALAEKISEALKPSFTEYGLTLDSFVVENLSLPDELQKVLDQRISMNVLGDMGKFTQYQVPLAERHPLRPELPLPKPNSAASVASPSRAAPSSVRNAESPRCSATASHERTRMGRRSLRMLVAVAAGHGCLEGIIRQHHP